MKQKREFPLGLIILSPLLLAAAFSVSPRPAGLNAALEGRGQMLEAMLPDGAAAKNQEVLDWEPWRVDLWEQSAALAFAAGNWPEAITLYSQARQQGSLSSAGAAQFGQAYLNNGDWQAAVATWDPLLAAGSAGRELFNKTLDLQWAAADFESAARTARLWLNADPANPQPAYRLGLLLSLEDGQQGLPFLLQAAQEDKSLAPAAQALGAALEKGTPQAGEGYRRVLVGRALGSLGYWDLARVELEKATQADPAYAEGWAYLGEARQQTGQDGLADLRRAEQLNPASLVTKGLLALWCRRNGQIGESIRYLSEAAALEPGRAAWQIEIGTSYLQGGDLFKAYNFFKLATELEPGSLPAWQALADFSVTNQFEVALVGQPAAAKLLELAPNRAAGMVLNGRAWMALADWQQAEQFLQQAVKQEPALPEANFYLGQFYLGQNRMDEAHHYLSRAASLAAKGSNIQALARRLLKQYFGEN